VSSQRTRRPHRFPKEVRSRARIRTFLSIAVLLCETILIRCMSSVEIGYGPGYVPHDHDKRGRPFDRSCRTPKNENMNGRPPIHHSGDISRSGFLFMDYFSRSRLVRDSIHDSQISNPKLKLATRKMITPKATSRLYVVKNSDNFPIFHKVHGWHECLRRYILQFPKYFFFLIKVHVIARDSRNLRAFDAKCASP